MRIAFCFLVVMILGCGPDPGNSSAPQPATPPAPNSPESESTTSLARSSSTASWVNDGSALEPRQAVPQVAELAPVATEPADDPDELIRGDDEVVPGPAAATPRDRIIQSLGDSNRGVQHVRELSIDSPDASITIAFDDNLFVAAGIQHEVVNTIKAILQSGQNVQSISLRGTFELVDKFGDSTEGEVVRAKYLRATLDRINWDNFDRRNIYAIADEVWLHPAIKR